MHRLIMGFPERMEIDHINGNSLDNRRSNLRVVTRSENARNSKKYSRNKTGVAGVSVGQSGGYVVYAMVNNKNTYLGTFASLDEAAATRRRAEIENGYHANHGRMRA
ncbi:MAG: HNH endonuclease [Gammaproteobacteria bacterium]|nr:HNH endonuclease [Gammaproteobacteria bacterium]MDP2346814.1 HNH endonuclease [Gammaproteobacteria bacterium]